VGGTTVGPNGVIVALTAERRRQEIAAWKSDASFDGASEELATFVEWLLAHPWTRSVSAATEQAVSEYILRFPADAQRELPCHPLAQCLSETAIDQACVERVLGNMTRHDLITEAERAHMLGAL
jgi:hypothetical protein